MAGRQQGQDRRSRRQDRHQTRIHGRENSGAQAAPSPRTATGGQRRAFNGPATYARTAFIEALGRAGVDVTADPVGTNPAAALPAKAEVDSLTSVAELVSLPLGEEVTYINKISFNVGGETMFCRLAVAAGSDDCEQGLLKGKEIWKAAGLDTNAVALVDGSGLTGNLVTPNSQVQLQTIMSERADARAWRGRDAADPGG